MKKKLFTAFALLLVASLACSTEFDQTYELPLGGADTARPTAEPVEPVELPNEGAENCDIVVQQDVAEHWAFTGMPIKKDLTFTYDPTTGVLRLDGSFPWVAVEGPVNLTKNGFVGAGVGTVAEYPDVSVFAEGNFKSSATTGLVDFSFDYTMGANGELPQGEPIIFGFTCMAVAQ